MSPNQHPESAGSKTQQRFKDSHCSISYPKTVAVDSQPVRCPGCFGRSFKLKSTAMWECDRCGKEWAKENLIDRAPMGCMTVSEGEGQDGIGVPEEEG